MGRKTTKILSGGWLGSTRCLSLRLWGAAVAGGLESCPSRLPVGAAAGPGQVASPGGLRTDSVAVPRALPSSFPSAPSFPGAVLLFRGENGDLGGGGTRPRSPSMEPGAPSPAFLCRSQSPSPRVSLSLVLPTVCAKAGVSRAPPVPCPELAPLGRNCITQLFFLYAGLVSDI